MGPFQMGKLITHTPLAARLFGRDQLYLNKGRNALRETAHKGTAVLRKAN